MEWLQVIRILMLIYDSLVLRDPRDKGGYWTRRRRRARISQLGLEVEQIWFRISVKRPIDHHRIKPQC